MPKRRIELRYKDPQSLILPLNYFGPFQSLRLDTKTTRHIFLISVNFFNHLHVYLDLSFLYNMFASLGWFFLFLVFFIRRFIFVTFSDNMSRKGLMNVMPWPEIMTILVLQQLLQSLDVTIPFALDHHPYFIQHLV